MDVAAGDGEASTTATQQSKAVSADGADG